MTHSPHDSDIMKQETEVAEFEKEMEDRNLKALGFDKAEGMRELRLPEDCSTFVSIADEGSWVGA